MARVNWKLIAAIIIAAAIVLLAVRRLTRSVPPFQPPELPLLRGLGSVERETAEWLQAVLDEDVNHLKVPGLQAFVRTPDGKTWPGASGTSDLSRKNPLQREHILRVGSAGIECRRPGRPL